MSWKASSYLFYPWGAEVSRNLQDWVWENWNCYLLLSFVNASSPLNTLTWEASSQVRTWAHIWIPQGKITSGHCSSTVARFWSNSASPHIPQYLCNTHLQIIKPFTFLGASTVANTTDSLVLAVSTDYAGLLTEVKEEYFCAMTCQNIFLVYPQGKHFPGRAPLNPGSNSASCQGGAECFPVLCRSETSKRH